jgi:SAM-dependent methyltransferase
MNNQFQKYANYYDAIYKEKDYQKEVDFLAQIIKKYSKGKVKNILSLGCGTASHDILLAKKGFKILGVDRSQKMIKIARQKAEKEKTDIKFKLADVTNFNFAKKFDFSMAMFNIVGYMIENEQMDKMLKNTAKLLKRSGLFVFDCWYGPAVLKSRPENKTRNIGEKIFRRTTQKLDIEKSIINITFEIIDNEKLADKENHKMRFWFLKELEYFLNKNNFKLVKVCNFMDLNSKISEDNWNIFVIAQKI